MSDLVVDHALDTLRVYSLYLSDNHFSITIPYQLLMKLFH